MPKMKKIQLKTKKWLGAMFWQNWVNEKVVKFRPLSRPEHVRYFHAYVYLKKKKEENKKSQKCTKTVCVSKTYNHTNQPREHFFVPVLDFFVDLRETRVLVLKNGLKLRK
jgi:hypothetical protein